ncbi:NADH:ubiquinone oxidoreductase kd subunit [Mytilinidion resinicola]|uniref:NADH:ubiquinone oxidoreductase kd subunit n=1 Tax=Mytilinidion resinicola TaxID=574789 RepID=A0A6A6YW82_9PEZI|nr:NADH:ubiquinone oxidoreductase kd subunit [Mytilinidion resinicola]KAF2812779.1 NADH:ubiquinone oxidoreductase kd subunit [Mytilinidion resinicola]
MLSRRIAAARPLTRVIPTTRPSLTQIRNITQADIDDPNMNGGYEQPPPIKRQLRDPYGDWWDKQERRNYNEPVHEDNDILGVFSPEEYRHFGAGWGGVLMGTFVLSVVGLGLTVKLFYPDKKAVPRTFPDGLEVELGGPSVLLAKKPGEDTYP